MIEILDRGRRIASGQEQEPKDPLDIFERWSIARNDLNARAVANRLDKVWRRLSTQQKQLLLRVAERIADAENIKSRWNPKATRSAQIKLDKMAVKAAHCAEEIIAALPPPWEGERKAIGELVAGLAAFVGGVVDASYPLAEELARDLASGVIRVLKYRNGQVRWELLRDLAWLASGKRHSPSERTIRRYLKSPPRFKTPGRAKWKRNWEMIREVCRFAPEGKGTPFETAARDYLNSRSS